MGDNEIYCPMNPPISDKGTDITRMSSRQTSAKAKKTSIILSGSTPCTEVPNETEANTTTSNERREVRSKS